MNNIIKKVGVFYYTYEIKTGYRQLTAKEKIELEKLNDTEGDDWISEEEDIYYNPNIDEYYCTSHYDAKFYTEKGERVYCPVFYYLDFTSAQPYVYFGPWNPSREKFKIKDWLNLQILKYEDFEEASYKMSEWVEDNFKELCAFGINYHSAHKHHLKPRKINSNKYIDYVFTKELCKEGAVTLDNGFKIEFQFIVE